MKYTIIAGTIVLLMAMLAGSLFAVDHPLLQLATMTPHYDLIRLALIVLLIGLLVTAPPRSVHFRIALAATAAVLFIGSTALMMEYTIGMLDALIFIEVAIIFAIEAVEAPWAEVVPVKKTARKKKAVSGVR